MAQRGPRVTECPMCLVEVTIPNSRPGATRRKYCDTCKTHPMHYEYRVQIAKHNITIDKCDELYAIPNCECCNRELTPGNGPGGMKPTTRNIDHCHATGEIRGVLCWDCNVGIGKLNDDVSGLQNAINYLERNKS